MSVEVAAIQLEQANLWELPLRIVKRAEEPAWDVDTAAHCDDCRDAFVEACARLEQENAAARERGDNTIGLSLCGVHVHMSEVKPVGVDRVRFCVRAHEESDSKMLSDALFRMMTAEGWA
jgi:hypothetical protein